MMTPLDIALWATASVCVAWWVWYHWSIGRELAHARHETSRFPMFAARDKLVFLIASGKMTEEDHGWRSLYDSVSFVLNIHQQLNQFDIMKRYVEYLVAVERNPRLRSHIEKAHAQEDYSARRVPEFARARQEVRTAFQYLIERRTTRWHKMLLVGLFARVLLVGIAMSAGVGTARRVSKSVSNPTYDTLVAWPQFQQHPA